MPWYVHHSVFANGKNSIYQLKPSRLLKIKGLGTRKIFLSKTIIDQIINQYYCSTNSILIALKVIPYLWIGLLKWSFTYKQHAWEPPQNHSWKIDLWPLQTEILKIKAGFTKKMPEKVEKITRTQFSRRPSDYFHFLRRFFGKTGLNLENFGL